MAIKAIGGKPGYNLKLNGFVKKTRPGCLNITWPVKNDIKKAFTAFAEDIQTLTKEETWPPDPAMKRFQFFKGHGARMEWEGDDVWFIMGGSFHPPSYSYDARFGIDENNNLLVNISNECEKIGGDKEELEQTLEISEHGIIKNAESLVLII